MAAPSDRRTSTDKATSTAATNSRLPTHCQVSANPPIANATAVSSTTCPSVAPLAPWITTSNSGFIHRLNAFWVTPGNAFDAAMKRDTRLCAGSLGSNSRRPNGTQMTISVACTGEERQADPTRVARPRRTVSVGQAQQVPPQADDGDDRDHEAVLELDEHRDDADRRRGLGPAGDEQVDRRRRRRGSRSSRSGPTPSTRG